MVVAAAAALRRPAAAAAATVVSRVALLGLVLALLLLLRRLRVGQGTDDADFLERDLGGVLLGVVLVLAAVPVACLP